METMWGSLLVMCVSFACIVYVRGAARDPDLYCSACRVVIDEIQYKISQVDPKQKLQVGSFRVDPNGNQGRYEVPYARSETHLIEEFELLCGSLANSYAKSTDKESGKKTFTRTSSRNGEALELSNIEMSQDTSRQLKGMCEHLLEEHEEEFINLLKEDQPATEELACVGIAEACSVEDLQIPMVILANPNKAQEADPASPSEEGAAETGDEGEPTKDDSDASELPVEDVEGEESDDHQEL